MAENVEFNALESNSNAVMAVADTVRTTLGPKGLDKLLIDQAMNRHVSNDGVTILLSLRAIHPVARMIVEIAERQEQLVGDGTTTAVVMSAEMIKEGKRLIKELGVHPTKVVEGIESGVRHACQLLEKEAKRISINDVELEHIIRTSLSSKLDGQRLASLVITALRTVGENAKYTNGEYDFNKAIMIIRKTSMEDQVVNGIVLERKRVDPELPLEAKKARVMITKLDLKPVKESWIKENNKYQEILLMENDRISKSREIVDAMLATGANTILIASPEVDQAVEDMLVARRVFAVRISTEEIEHLSRYTGAKPVRVMEDLKRPDILGNVERVYEDEDNSMIYLEGGSGRNMVTILVSGTTKETSLERWRAASDGVNAAEAALNKGIVPGGGAAEAALDLAVAADDRVGRRLVGRIEERHLRAVHADLGPAEVPPERHPGQAEAVVVEREGEGHDADEGNHDPRVRDKNCPPHQQPNAAHHHSRNRPQHKERAVADR